MLIFNLCVLNEICRCWLQVLNLKGNPQFVGITDLKHLHSLKELHLDDDLAVALPAELKKLAQ